jgi:hypothetical protein
MAANQKYDEQLIILGLKEASTLFPSDMQRKAYAYAKTATTTAYNALKASNASVRKVAEVVNTTGRAGTATAALISGFASGKYEQDASGITLAADVSSAAKGLVGVATSFGMPRSVGETATKMVDALAGCAVGIAATAPAGGFTAVAGVVGCAFSMFTAVSSLFKQPAPEPTLAPHVPRTVYAPEQYALQVAAIDAYRLIKVLKPHYEIQSYAELARKFDDITPAVGSYRNYLTAGKYPPNPRTAKVPGVDMRDLLYALSYNMNPAWTPDQIWRNIDASILFLLTQAFEGREDKMMQYPPPYGYKNHARGHFARMASDSDIPPWLIEIGAMHGRMWIAKNGQSLRHKYIPLTSSGDLAMVGNPSNLQYVLHKGMYNQYSFVARKGFGVDTRREGYHIDLSPFVVLDDLINYFAAVSLQEQKQTTQALYKFLQYGLPIRWTTINKGDPGYSTDGYAEQIWSNFDPREPVDSVLSSRRRWTTHGDLLTKSALYANDYTALRVVGMLRLMTAATLLHQQYRWTASNPSPVTGSDPIRELQVVPKSHPFFQFESAIDPRTIYHRPNGKWVLAGGTPANFRSGRRPEFLVDVIEKRENEIKSAINTGRKFAGGADNKPSSFDINTAMYAISAGLVAAKLFKG